MKTALDTRGEPLSPEALRMLDYLRTRSEEMSTGGIRERIRAAALELDKLVGEISETEARTRPFSGKWTIAEVVDHIAQTQIRGAEELRHLLAGRRPPGPPVYEALRSGASAWAPWAELVDGLREANQSMLDLLESAPDGPEEPGAPTVRTILVVTRTLPNGETGPQIFVGECSWKEYAILQRLHLLDHRTQVKNIRASIAGR